MAAEATEEECTQAWAEATEEVMAAEACMAIRCSNSSHKSILQPVSPYSSLMDTHLILGEICKPQLVRHSFAYYHHLGGLNASLGLAYGVT